MYCLELGFVNLLILSYHTNPNLLAFIYKALNTENKNTKLLHHLGEGVYKLQIGNCKELNLNNYYNHIEYCTKMKIKNARMKNGKRNNFYLVLWKVLILT